MPARTKYVGPDASLRTIYRNILKACARHPDRYVGEWYAGRWRGKLRSWAEQDLSPVEWLSKTSQARTILSKLQRSAAGDKEAFEFVVSRAYGGTGAGRWPLLAPFIRSSVLPPAISILRDRPHRKLPTYSPFLVCAADSPHFLENPRPPLRLALPDTLPDHGLPGNPELVNRQFLEPARETNLRKQYYHALLERIKVPIAVRVVGVQQEAGAEPINVSDKLKALGIDWREFADGRREVLLDRLETLAGKGATPLSSPSPPRRPIEQVNLSLPPQPPSAATCSPSAIPRPDAPPAYPIPQTIHHSSLPPARYPDGYQTTYRELLANFPILTVDLSRTSSPNEWLGIQFSPWAHNGPGFYHPVDPTDDVPFLAATAEKDVDVFDFPEFAFDNPLKRAPAGSDEATARAAAAARHAAKMAAVEAEAERRTKLVFERMVAQGMTVEQIAWEMQGKWDQQDAEGTPQQSSDAQDGDGEAQRSLERKTKRAKERQAKRTGVDAGA